MEQAPRLRLENGIRVANFSSPHPFRFDTGEELEGCSPERCRILSLRREETEFPGPGGRWTDVVIGYSMTPEVLSELRDLEADPEVDIILVPLPVMVSLRGLPDSGVTKARTCILTDRVEKKVSSTRFGA